MLESHGRGYLLGELGHNADADDVRSVDDVLVVLADADLLREPGSQRRGALRIAGRDLQGNAGAFFTWDAEGARTPGGEIQWGAESPTGPCRSQWWAEDTAPHGIQGATVTTYLNDSSRALRWIRTVIDRSAAFSRQRPVTTASEMVPCEECAA